MNKAACNCLQAACVLFVALFAGDLLLVAAFKSLFGLAAVFAFQFAVGHLREIQNIAGRELGFGVLGHAGAGIAALAAAEFDLRVLGDAVHALLVQPFVWRGQAGQPVGKSGAAEQQTC